MIKDSTETDSLVHGSEPSSNDEKNQVTTGQRILDLAIPASAALLIDPLMTLADTAFVGHYSANNADPLAGMGSAAALLTFSFYLFNFLCTATTPLVSSRRSAGLEDEAVAVAGQSLSLALCLGFCLTAGLLTLKQPLLRVMGTSITGAVANGYALDFLSIRALAAPAILCIEASIGALRGFLDTKTPIVILIIANLLNLLLDVVLIVWAGLGPLGAAIATTSAEYISAGLFLAVLAGALPSASGTIGSNASRDVSGNREPITIVPLLSVPSWNDVQPLIVASSSVFCRALVLQLFLSAAAIMAARGGATMATGAAASVAAHQIGIQLWLLCSFFCDSLAAASQGLIADALGRRDMKDVVDVSKTIFSYSLVLGLFLASILQVGVWTDWLYNIFTQDPLTRANLAEILPLIILAQPLNALVFAADGVLQGASEFPFQAKGMALSGVTAVAGFGLLQTGRGDVDTLVHVWSAILILQLMRGLTSSWKILDPQGPINLLAVRKGRFN